MVDVSIPRDARPSERLEATFRLKCVPEGHVRFAVLGGRDLRLAREGREIRRRCKGCRTDVRFEIVAPRPEGSV